MHEGRSELIRTEAAFSANNKLCDRSNYHPIVKSQYIIPPPNGPGRGCLSKKKASSRLISWTKMGHTIPLEGSRYTVRYLSFVI